MVTTTTANIIAKNIWNQQHNILAGDTASESKAQYVGNDVLSLSLSSGTDIGKINRIWHDSINTTGVNNQITFDLSNLSFTTFEGNITTHFKGGNIKAVYIENLSGTTGSLEIPFDKDDAQFIGNLTIPSSGKVILTNVSGWRTSTPQIFDLSFEQSAKCNIFLAGITDQGEDIAITTISGGICLGNVELLIEPTIDTNIPIISTINNTNISLTRSLSGVATGISTLAAELIALINYSSFDIPVISTINNVERTSVNKPINIDIKSSLISNFVPLSLSPSLLNGLYAYWKMDEAGGTRFDSHNSFNLNDGNSTPEVVGIINSGAGFTKSSNHFLFLSSHNDNGPMNIGNTGTVSFSTWAWLNNLLTTEGVLSVWSNVSNQRGYVLYFAPGVSWKWRFYENGGNTPVNDVDWTGTVVADRWYHIVGIVNRVDNFISLIVDNQPPVTLSPIPTIHHSTAAYTVGATSVPSIGIDGRIDEMGIWSRVLTTGVGSEVASLFNNGIGKTYNFS